MNYFTAFSQKKLKIHTPKMTPQLKNYSKSYDILMQIVAQKVMFFFTVFCNKLIGTVSMSSGANPGVLGLLCGLISVRSGYIL
jgi:hypothetical protein